MDDFARELAEFAQLSLPDKLLSAFSDMLAMSEHQLHLPVKEMVVDGMYVREVVIPKGTFLVGRIHRQASVNICSQGMMDIVSDTGCFTVKGPFTAISSPGVFKLGYAHEDTIWTNVFRTDETDLSKVDNLIAFNYQEMRSMLDPIGRFLPEKIACQLSL